MAKRSREPGRGRGRGSVLGRGLDTIIQDTATNSDDGDIDDSPSGSSSRSHQRADDPDRELVSEIVSIRVTARQKEFITLFDKYKPTGESFAVTFRTWLDGMDSELGAKLREIETEAKALAARLLG